MNKYVGPEFRKKLNAHLTSLADDVLDSCLLYMDQKVLCSACNHYLMEMATHPEKYVELPSGRLLIDIPKCTTYEAM